MSSAESQVEHKSLEGEQKATKRKISLSRCGVCGSKEANYRCPACLTNSCSLLCVKKHKDDSGCSGVRNKTEFVTLSHFDEITLLNDYRFLEDTGRFADGATRDNLIRSPRTTLKAKKMGSHARKMNITLRFLPVTFTKSRENSTFFLTKEKLFLWHLKLVFPQSSSEFSRRRVSDRQTLNQILTAYIHPTESDPVTRQKLKMYTLAPFEDVKVFMKAEGRKANSVRYHELEIEKSLRENLNYKTIIEYPVLHVVLRDHWTEYPLKGPAESASTCTSSAAKNDGMDEEEEPAVHVPASTQRSRTQERSNIWTGVQETAPETEPPLEKRAKRGAGEEEQEEGEIIDSSDEDKIGNCDEKVPCDDARGPTNGVEEADDGSVSTAAGRDVSSPSPDRRGGADVRVSKEDAAEQLGLVHAHHCRDGNESADAADSCQMEQVEVSDGPTRQEVPI